MLKEHFCTVRQNWTKIRFSEFQKHRIREKSANIFDVGHKNTQQLNNISCCR